jgi:copper chaperone
MQSIALKVDGMTCGGCVKSIQTALNSQAGVSETTADLESAMVTVEFNDSVIQATAIKAAIEAAGFDVVA